MLELLEKELAQLQVFNAKVPEIVEAIVESIPSNTIPHKMKMAFAISEIILYISQFRYNIKHWNDSIIPINYIMFCIASSGAYKDSSIKAARKCFDTSYTLINKKRQEYAVDRAIICAEEAGCDTPQLFSTYKDYYISPNPLFVAISTPEGFIQHLNDLDDNLLGSGFIYSGELGAELGSSSAIVDNIKVLSELYDEGTKEVKIIKNRDTQSREIKNLPVSALFVGSQENILYDDDVKRKFKTEFTSKLARRSTLIFVNEPIAANRYTDLQKFLKEERQREEKAKQKRIEVSSYLEKLTEYLFSVPNTRVQVTEEARNVFLIYKRYNEELASTVNKTYIMSKLTRNHLHWKALKLSGAFALLEGSTLITEEHYKSAIKFYELTIDDINKFEKELLKESYELFVEYCKYYMIDSEFSIGLHELRKAGFISAKGPSKAYIKELAKLANSCDENNLYEVENDSIRCSSLVDSDSILLSYVECTGTKEQRMRRCASGYTCEEIKFKDLEDMLKGSYAYSPFRFNNGIRGQEYIGSGCKWLVFDVDKSGTTDEEVHVLLSDINHYVVRTSNPDNANKFRVLVELAAEVNIPNIQWTNFTQLIARDLGLVADRLPKAQIALSYPDRNILSQLEGTTIDVKPYLAQLSDTTYETFKKPVAKECKAMLDNPLETFYRAFDAGMGEGSRKLIWAARKCQELDASKEYTLDLLRKINDYWCVPLDNDRFESTIINQVSKWVFNG